jgi:uncharacterized protein (TIGR02001 family)
VRAMRALAATIFICLAAPPCLAARTWGGSVALTSDYLVRGISRSNQAAALQADLHLASTKGIVGGLSVSSVQIAPRERRNSELGAFLGLAWNVGAAWQARIMANHYSYPWNAAGSKYDYDEVSAEATYLDWLNFNVMYSPNSPRYLPYAGLIGVTAKSYEVNLQQPWRRQWAVSAGVGYSQVAGPAAEDYTYWSVGGLYEQAPLSFSVSYISTSAAARNLFYDAAAHNRWSATLVWRF